MAKTPTPVPDPDLQATIAKLDEQLTHISKNLTTINRVNRINRHALWMLGVSVLLNMVLSVGLVFYAHQTSGLVDTVGRNSVTIRTACMTHNDENAKQVGLWEGIIALPSTKPSSPETLTHFRALLAIAYPQKIC